MWTRQRGDSEDEPPGMGIMFISLDEQSRRLIRWLIDRGLASAEPTPDPGSAGAEAPTSG